MAVGARDSGAGPLADLIGHSDAIRLLRANVDRLLRRQRVSGRFPGLLILGETGTGKGLLARCLHRASSLANAPFVTVDCAAIPETLMEAELFGFERGAFTDARQGKLGLFQVAHRGLIFLDEVGLLPKALQGKLLTVVEEHVVRRLGGTRSEAVDVQILAATNEDLASAVGDGRFRSDLFHRLAAVTLTVPPLRDRGRDIILLAELFLARACRASGLAPKVLSPEAKAALLAHPWPGNVRELANGMEQVTLMCEETLVTADLLVFSASTVGGAPVPVQPAIGAASFRSSLAMVERDRLLDALRGAKWNLTVTAERLGMPRNTLRYRMAKVGIGPGDVPIGSQRWPRDGGSSVVGPGPATRRTHQSGQRQTRQIALLRAVRRASADASALDEPDFRALVPAIEQLGGVVEEADGSTIQAVFGLDRRGDPLGRAAHAALEIRRGLTHGGVADPSLAPRIAIHSCPALVERSGGLPQLDAESRRLATAATDDLLERAEPGVIRIGAAAAPLLQGRFDLRSVGPNGAAAAAHRLESAQVAWPSAGEWPQTPFVGRTPELALLERLVEQVLQGRGQVVGIVGAPGSGKTRLLYELWRRLQDRPLAVRYAHCAPHADAWPGFTIRQLLRDGFQITDTDDAPARAAKVDAGLSRLELAPADWASLLLPLVGGPALDGPSPSRWLERPTQGAFESLRRFCLEWSKREPLIVQLDDAHRLGKRCEEFLLHLTDGITGGRILVLAAYRPGCRPPWLGRSHATQLVLHPLTALEGCTIIDSILPAAARDERVVRTIIDRAEGNPFFLEQLAVRARELGESLGGLTIPDSVRSVVHAQLDELDPRTRHLLLAAAVVGRVVPLGVLHRVSGERATLARRLTELKELELLETRVASGEIAYAFRYGLVQAVAYESLTAADRHAFHAAVGQVLERADGDRVGE